MNCPGFRVAAGVIIQRSILRYSNLVKRGEDVAMVSDRNSLWKASPASLKISVDQCHQW